MLLAFLGNIRNTILININELLTIERFQKYIRISPTIGKNAKIGIVPILNVNQFSHILNRRLFDLAELNRRKSGWNAGGVFLTEGVVCIVVEKRKAWESTIPHYYLWGKNPPFPWGEDKEVLKDFHKGTISRKLKKLGKYSVAHNVHFLTD